MLFVLLFSVIIMDEEKKRFIERGSHKGKGIAVFTSGGDSQGEYYNIQDD